jgi:hypothetical protein
LAAGCLRAQPRRPWRNSGAVEACEPRQPHGRWNEQCYLPVRRPPTSLCRPRSGAHPAGASAEVGCCHICSSPDRVGQYTLTELGMRGRPRLVRTGGLRLDPLKIPRPAPFDALPRLPVWFTLQAFLDWLPDAPLAQWNSVGSSQLPISSRRGRGGIRMSIQSAKLAAAHHLRQGHQ